MSRPIHPEVCPGTMLRTVNSVVRLRPRKRIFSPGFQPNFTAASLETTADFSMSAAVNSLPPEPLPCSGAAPIMSTPKSMAAPLPLPATRIGCSITGESFARTGKPASLPTYCSSTPPLAVTVRSILPVSVASDDWNDPTAASPARSIAITTATPRATERILIRVRIGSARRGRSTIRRNSFTARYLQPAQYLQYDRPASEPEHLPSPPLPRYAWR